MTPDKDLFDRDTALSCFGSEAILKEVLVQFLDQADPMYQRLKDSVNSCDKAEVRKAVHWFKGGLCYLYSAEVERICARLDHQSEQEPMLAMNDTLTELQNGLNRLKARVALMR
jgi:HPt (histidine-containing phosphotransfer) domain-containing protein